MIIKVLIEIGIAIVIVIEQPLFTTKSAKSTKKKHLRRFHAV